MRKTAVFRERTYHNSTYSVITNTCGESNGENKELPYFDSPLPIHLTDIADRLFYICCVLTNFQPPLCT